ncbi:hypothetical protein Q0590_09400 [Rhodocytophaga aerolata]|uniref:Uncharacterized protein n=1 Tax=Rhodocytophaga aerolata TaxID=455078 RepID=A0ABT8R2Z5_9BACT|nr:hypothetical protein [Rhodocytophaga aerolata]MDO1446463.1 hypothetical protein [Rhodocytophaga aerolata]
MGNYIELIKNLPEDNQTLSELKDTFNKDAQEMNLNWPKLSMERRRELCSKMSATQVQITALKTEEKTPTT